MRQDDPAGALQTVADAVGGGHGGRLAAVVSAVALAFSGFSLWETSLKSADLKVHASTSISYLRDPFGGYEVVVMPLTIVNGGARDAAVTALHLDVANAANGKSERFHASFTADAAFFGTTDDVSKRQRRPKLPFAPLSVAGRAAWSGTILFYGPEPKEAREARVLEPQSKVEMTLHLATPGADGWLDRLLGSQPAPLAMKAEVPSYLVGAVLSGDMARLRLGEKGN